MARPNGRLAALMEQVGVMPAVPIIGANGYASIAAASADPASYGDEYAHSGDIAAAEAPAEVDDVVGKDARRIIAAAKKGGNRASDKVALANNRALDMARFVDAMATMQPVLARYGIVAGYQFAAGKFTLTGNIAPILSWLRSQGFKEDSNAGGVSTSLYSVAAGGVDWPRSLRGKVSELGDDYAKANVAPQRMTAASVEQEIDRFIADYKAHIKMRREQ